MDQYVNATRFSAFQHDQRLKSLVAGDPNFIHKKAIPERARRLVGKTFLTILAKIV
jgi:hypothetical protein